MLCPPSLFSFLGRHPLPLMPPNPTSNLLCSEAFRGGDKDTEPEEGRAPYGMGMGQGRAPRTGSSARGDRLSGGSESLAMVHFWLLQQKSVYQNFGVGLMFAKAVHMGRLPLRQIKWLLLPAWCLQVWLL